jgi:alpha-tubulin suppressor-like RCC1 family protein
VSIGAGRNYTCAVKSDGTVGCWGENAQGQAPSTVTSSLSFTQVSAGASHTDGAGHASVTSTASEQAGS